MVQPRVNAAGNHATTTGFFPLKSDSWYVLPSVACSLKLGAWSPTLRSAVCAIAALARPRTRVTVNNARIAQPPGLLEASEYTRVFSVAAKGVIAGRVGAWPRRHPAALMMPTPAVSA